MCSKHGSWGGGVLWLLIRHELLLPPTPNTDNTIHAPCQLGDYYLDLPAPPHGVGKTNHLAHDAFDDVPETCKHVYYFTILSGSLIA